MLVPQADGAGNDLMVGRYLQIGIVFTILFVIPGLLVWSFFMYDTIIWFGFDEATATIAQNYTYSILLAKMAENIDECLIEFLDVIDRELYITIYSVVSEIVSTGMLVAIAYSGMSSMVLIGVVETAVRVTLLVTNLAIIINKGWLDDYEEGLFKTCGLKVREKLQYLLTHTSKGWDLILNFQKHESAGLASDANDFCHSHASRYSLDSNHGGVASHVDICTVSSTPKV